MKINLDNYALISLDKIRNYKDLIQKDKIEIISKNEYGIVNAVPHNNIDFLFNEDCRNNILFDKAEYYIYKSYLEMIEFFVNPNSLNNKDYFYSIFTSCKDPIENVRTFQEKMLEAILSMNYFRRIENIKELILKLEIEENRDKFTCKAAEIVGEILVKLGLMQRINVIGNISDNELFDSNNFNINYEELLRSVAESVFVLLNKPYEKNDIFTNTMGFTGYNIIDHSNRIFINTIEYMIFYNKNINMGILSKIRAKWKNEYMVYYDKVSKKIDLLKIQVN
ncbi:hypothetical protein [Brachyspira murdochii]|uniref:hypothetical protein n=1 Tax=Brachyspira murdochii TaxID=84378 RepID=UPI0021589301|nr:hypothetical protein [Brachyspira murdochii]